MMIMGDADVRRHPPPGLLVLKSRAKPLLRLLEVPERKITLGQACFANADEGMRVGSCCIRVELRVSLNEVEQATVSASKAALLHLQQRM
jgi:hypothetical protein